MGFIDRDKFIVFDKTFYNNKDIIIVGIVDKVFKFK